MSSIPERWHDDAMAFALDIAQKNDNFPKKVLSLFDKHFGYRRSIFFPYNYSTLSASSPKRSNSLSNYITYGISYGPMYDYKDHVYKDDIFRYSNLPPHLKGKRVIFTNDVMTPEVFEKTPFGIHMMSVDMYYQACLFFYMGDRVIASMGLFRSINEEPFSEEDRSLLEYLGGLIEVNYQTFLRHSGEAKFHDGFNMFFQDMKVGAVVLNQDLTVMQANQTAKELSRVFWDQFRHNQSHFLRSNYQGEAQFREVQTMVNEMSEKFTAQGNNNLTISSIVGDMTFHHSSFLSTSVTGIIQTWHILVITCKTKELPQDMNHPYNTLTQQERRIVHYLSTGMKNEQIAQDLHISIYTVRTHMANIYKKFEVGNKVDLLMRLQPYLQAGVEQSRSEIE
ncbi:MAG: helix-turn-helix transcriptional regulator [Evtepia sp.]